MFFIGKVHTTLVTWKPMEIRHLMLGYVGFSLEDGPRVPKSIMDILHGFDMTTSRKLTLYPTSKEHVWRPLNVLHGRFVCFGDQVKRSRLHLPTPQRCSFKCEGREQTLFYHGNRRKFKIFRIVFKCFFSSFWSMFSYFPPIHKKRYHILKFIRYFGLEGLHQFHLLSRNMEFPKMILLDVLFLFLIRKGYGVYVYNYRHI